MPDEMNLTPAPDLNELAAAVHAENQKWWHDPATGKPIKRDKGEMLMLMVSELSEAMEGARKNLPDDHLPHRDMFEVELAADALDRLTRELQQERERSANAFEIVAKWHEKNAAICEEAANDDPRLNADDRRRAAEAGRHHRASAASIRLKMIDQRQAEAKAFLERFHGR